jgi:hypothetical protein
MQPNGKTGHQPRQDEAICSKVTCCKNKRSKKKNWDLHGLRVMYNFEIIHFMHPA